jgi:hypothetical protein
MVRKHAVLWGAALAGIGLALWWPPIAQPPEYVVFADHRAFLGVANGFDVLSNVPFAIVGIAGLVAISRGRRPGMLANDWDAWPYGALFAGVAMASVGSTYFHLAPDNARLFWDRLPMTVGFMGLLTALLAERVSRRTARALFVPLLAAGAASVIYWYWTELHHAGDLRPYLVVQFGSLALVVLILWLYPGRGRDTAYIALGLSTYAAAKGLELADAPIFEATGQLVSGHTLKHLAAAGGVACLVAMLRVRAAVARDATLPERAVAGSASP